MSIILNSSVLVTAERHHYTVAQLIEKVMAITGDQDAALTSIGLTELVHGIYRAQSPEVRRRRQPS